MMTRKYENLLVNDLDRMRLINMTNITEEEHWFSKNPNILAIQFGPLPVKHLTAAWILFKGPIGPGEQVKRMCSAPGCYSPDHAMKLLVERTEPEEKDWRPFVGVMKTDE